MDRLYACLMLQDTDIDFELDPGGLGHYLGLVYNAALSWDLRDDIIHTILNMVTRWSHLDFEVLLYYMEAC